MSQSLYQLGQYLEFELLNGKKALYTRHLEGNPINYYRFKSQKIIYNALRYMPAWHQEGRVFGNFTTLSNVILASNLSKYDKLGCMFAFIRLNLSDERLTEERIYFFDPLTKENEITEKLLSVFGFDEKRGIPSIDEDELKTIDLPSFIAAHNQINEAYFNKLFCYEECDIDTIIAALSALKVSESFLALTRTILQKNIKKRTPKEEVKIQKPQEIETQEPLISNRAQKFIIKELNNYYSLEACQLVRPLSYEEIVYSAYLMLKLNMAKTTIKEFIMAALAKITKTEISPQALYAQIYPKIIAYSEIPAVQNQAKELQDILAETFICHEDDYQFWCTTLQDELKTLIDFLPSDGEFEFAKAHELLLTQPPKGELPCSKKN